MATAAEARAQADEPAPATARSPAQAEKRAAEDGEEGNELPEPKRRRACVAALESVRRAAGDAAEENGDGDGGAGEPAADGGSSFSFHARSFSGVETTPKFGSFNPADDLLVAFQLKPPPPLPPMDAPAKEEAPAAPPATTMTTTRSTKQQLRRAMRGFHTSSGSRPVKSSSERRF